MALLALGDFEPGNDAAEVLPLTRSGAALRFPAATRAVSARVDDTARAFTGYGERRGDAGLDLLLWPERETCKLPSRGYPGRHGGQALGFSPDAELVLAAGGNDPLDSDALLGWLSFDAATGALVARGREGGGALGEPRAFASLTPFGSQLLLAGGEKPVLGVPERDIEPYASAELFDPARGRFTGESISLESARTHHAALVLDDGRTLLIGGRAKVGSTSIAQYQLEVVDPLSKHARIADAIAARIDPRALRLSDGRIFVGGGTALDGSPVSPVGQWLTPEARVDATRLSSDVAPRFDRAFAALPGGGVLAVGGCEDRPASSDDDAERCSRCAHGCVPLEGYDAWWIDRDGDATPVSLDGISAPRPLLLPGSDGSPWLVADADDAPGEARLFRFNPWAASFDAVALPRGRELPSPDQPAPVEVGLDSFVWLGAGAGRDQLFGLRLGTRGRYAQDLALVLSADPLDPGRPEHLAPSRALGDSAGYDGRLTLVRDDVTIEVADTDYADVTVSLRLDGESRHLPVVALGDAALGGPDCPWPDPRPDSDEPPSVVRTDTRALLHFRGGEPRACSVPAGRLRLGLRAGAERTVIDQLEIERSAR